MLHHHHQHRTLAIVFALICSTLFHFTSASDASVFTECPRGKAAAIKNDNHENQVIIRSLSDVDVGLFLESHEKEKEILLKETLTTTTTSTIKPNYVYTETDYFLAVKSKTGKAKMQSILLRMESEDGGADSFTLQSNYNDNNNDGSAKNEETSICQSENSRGIVISPKPSVSLWNHSIQTKLYHLYDHVNVDVTVVMEDGEHAHSHFKFATVPQLPMIVKEVVPKPSRALQEGDDTGSTSGTFEPTITPLPTYETCYVCGSPNEVVTAPQNTFFLGQEEFICSEIDFIGIAGFIPPAFCEILSDLASDSCGCSADANAGPIPTSSPTITASPTGGCYLCGSPDLYIANAELEVEFLGETFTCRDLEFASAFFPPVLCRQATIVAEACGCSVTASPTPLDTFAPTITAYPTATPLPTFSEPCYICGDETLRLDPALQPAETITLGGFAYTCQEYEDGGLGGLIDPNLCQAVQDIIATTGSCTCISMFTPAPQTPAPTPTAPTTRLPTIRPTDAPPSMAPIQPTVTTFEPTVSGFPTITSQPTFSEPCYMCGNENTALDVSKQQPTPETIVYQGRIFTCLELQEVALKNLFDPAQCALLQTTVAAAGVEATGRQNGGGGDDGMITTATTTGCSCRTVSGGTTTTTNAPVSTSTTSAPVTASTTTNAPMSAPTTDTTSGSYDQNNYWRMSVALFVSIVSVLSWIS